MNSLQLIEAILTDGSKVYSVRILNRIEINCDSLKDANILYDFLLKYDGGICDMGKY
jgi:hypothetical protein